jgi:hypothetical protein
MPASVTSLLNYHGRRLLRQLRELRLQAGLTQTQAGDRVRMEFQKLSRIENIEEYTCRLGNDGHRACP